MSSSQIPIGGGGPRDPYEKFRVERIEEDKLTKGESPKLPEKGPPNEKLGIAAYLLQLLRKTVDFFLEKSGTSQSIELDIRENLLLLKASFEILKKEDRSQDVEFLNQLSKIWRRALEDALHFKNDAIAFKFKVLVNKIQHYPENQPHTFGYYMMENANQKWIPFPYMELIQKVHKEHERSPATSALTEWIILLDELTTLLK